MLNFQYTAIFHFYDALGSFGKLEVVGYDKLGLMKALGQLLKYAEYDFRIFFVQIAGGFVAHDNEGIVYERSGNGYPHLS